MYVNNWRNRRFVQVLSDQVALQVTMPGCSHCVTCQARVQQLDVTVAQKAHIIHQWKTRDDGAYWLFLPLKNNQDPLQLLRDVLDVKIER